MEDKALQDKINKRLYESISPLLIEEGEGQANSTIWAGYQVQRFDDDILSVTFDVSAYMEGAAHPNNILISANIDLKTGEDYSLDQLFEDGFDYKQDLFEKGNVQLENFEFPLLDEFKGIDEGQEFYLTEYQLVVYYQPYVYTPHAYGPLKLYFEYEGLEKLAIPIP